MYVAGGCLGLAAVAVPHGTGVDELPWAINSALGVPVGVALFLGRRHVRIWMLHALLVTGAAMVALGMLFGDGGPASVATSFFYVWVALYVSWFFSFRTTVTHLLVDSLIFAAVLAVEGSVAGPAVWLLVMGTAAMVSGVVRLMHRELLRVATLDALTGLPTRTTLDSALEHHIARAQRTSSTFAVVMLDVDDLKSVNDELGHQAGDAALAASAVSWRAALRDSDVLVRFGGDEFVAVLPDCRVETAEPVVERLRAAAPTSCSIGWAMWRPNDTAASLLERADVTLYEAKRARRAPSQVLSTVNGWCMPAS
jgi:diguanylate cyclase (GGDEF)-like protein